MYQIIITIIFFALLSSIIFRKKIKEKKIQNRIFYITLIGTIIVTTTLSGIYGDNAIEIKTEEWSEKLTDIDEISKIRIDSASTICLTGLIALQVKINKSDSINYIKFSDVNINYFSNYKQLIIILSDTIDPKFIRYSQKRVLKTKWVCSTILPTRKKIYEVYLPNDVVHQKIVYYIDSLWNNKVKIIIK